MNKYLVKIAETIKKGKSPKKTLKSPKRTNPLKPKNIIKKEDKLVRKTKVSRTK
jgi:hypothetical protein